MSNFTFLLSDPGFASFADVAISAEKLLHIDPAACIINCRRSMEFAVKWMYSVDAALEMPYQDNLITLMSQEEFHTIVGPDLWQRMDFIRKKGNSVAHYVGRISESVAMLCLENLHIFLDFVAYCYADEYVETKFDPEIVRQIATAAASSLDDAVDLDLAALIEENKKLKAQLTTHRMEQQQTYVPKPLDISEYETRKYYIDAMLEDAGWVEGRNWRNEVELPDGESVADYVLYDGNHRPLALIEAKRTCMDVSQGRRQAERYADLLEARYGRRPVIFLTNGFETHILDGRYPERECACVYAPGDLEKLFNLRQTQAPLKTVAVKKQIAGRYYQEAAVRAVCDALEEDRRKALLVMAAGTGKTRTVIALCDVLLRQGWVKNILFLADRDSLVTQAKRSFEKLLPTLSCTNLCEETDNYTANCVFSTYRAVTSCIDSVLEGEEKLFTCGYFDLVICDEAHRSIYRKYRDVFRYFDAPLVGLTATPKNEIDRETYAIFEPERGQPTYSYDLARAVKDGFLVDFLTVETDLQFADAGVAYEDLPEAEREAYENTFTGETGDLPDKIVSSALNAWIFSDATIREALRVLMREGHRIDQGRKLGKTILFAKNHAHAEKICQIFNKEYPHLPGFIAVIDSDTQQAQSLIDRFSDPGKLPQIAISVDMLDTGIDVPECLNLVFFKRVMSKAKFWQMLGRGARLCPGLRDGADKDTFYIFDFCGNFAFFRMGRNGREALPARIFRLQAQLVCGLRSAGQEKALTGFRKHLVDDMVRKVRLLDKENFAVRQHLKFVELYADPAQYEALTDESARQMGDELAPLITAADGDEAAERFDALLYGMALAQLTGKRYDKEKGDLRRQVKALAALSDLPASREQSRLIQQIQQADYWKTAGIPEFEQIRKQLRSLCKYIPAD